MIIKLFEIKHKKKIQWTVQIALQLQLQNDRISDRNRESFSMSLPINALSRNIGIVVNWQRHPDDRSKIPPFSSTVRLFESLARFSDPTISSILLPGVRHQKSWKKQSVSTLEESLCFSCTYVSPLSPYFTGDKEPIEVPVQWEGSGVEGERGGEKLKTRDHVIQTVTIEGERARREKESVYSRSRSPAFCNSNPRTEVLHCLDCGKDRTVPSNSTLPLHSDVLIELIAGAFTFLQIIIERIVYIADIGRANYGFVISTSIKLNIRDVIVKDVIVKIIILE